MLLSKAKIAEMPKRYRAAFVNSLSGFKSANLIGTTDSKGQNNLSIVSSVVHLGSDPALMGFIVRPPVVPRHSYENIIETGFFTINHVNQSIQKQAHQTSARYLKEESEFDKAGLTAGWVDDFIAPYVKESNLSMGMSLEQDVAIEANGTCLIIGRVEWVMLDQKWMGEDGFVNLVDAGTSAISGLDAYHQAVEPIRFTYAKPDRELQVIK